MGFKAAGGCQCGGCGGAGESWTGLVLRLRAAEHRAAAGTWGLVPCTEAGSARGGDVGRGSEVLGPRRAPVTVVRCAGTTRGLREALLLCALGITIPWSGCTPGLGEASSPGIQSPSHLCFLHLHAPSSAVLAFLLPDGAPGHQPGLCSRSSRDPVLSTAGFWAWLNAAGAQQLRVVLGDLRGLFHPKRFYDFAATWLPHMPEAGAGCRARCSRAFLPQTGARDPWSEACLCRGQRAWV